MHVPIWVVLSAEAFTCVFLSAPCPRRARTWGTTGRAAFAARERAVRPYMHVMLNGEAQIRLAELPVTAWESNETHAASKQKRRKE